MDPATVLVITVWALALLGWAWYDRRARRRFEHEVRSYDE